MMHLTIFRKIQVLWEENDASFTDCFLSFKRLAEQGPPTITVSDHEIVEVEVLDIYAVDDEEVCIQCRFEIPPCVRQDLPLTSEELANYGKTCIKWRLWPQWEDCCLDEYSSTWLTLSDNGKDILETSCYNERLTELVESELSCSNVSTITVLTEAAQSGPFMGDLVKAESVDEVISIARRVGFALDAQELLAFIKQFPGNSEIDPDLIQSTPIEGDVWLSCWKNTLSGYVNDLSLKFGIKIWIDDRVLDDGTRRLGMVVGGPLVA